MRYGYSLTKLPSYFSILDKMWVLANYIPILILYLEQDVGAC